jgi:hypothetical protein
VHENASVRYATLANLASWLGSGRTSTVMIASHAMPCHSLLCEKNNQLIVLIIEIQRAVQFYFTAFLAEY